MSDAAVEMLGIDKAFPGVVANRAVDFRARWGEVHALLGENGAGKSTLMNVVSGEVQPDSGEMTLDGTRYAPSAPHDARGRGVALIHQELSLCPHLSVTDNRRLRSGRPWPKHTSFGSSAASRRIDSRLSAGSGVKNVFGSCRPGTPVIVSMFVNTSPQISVRSESRQ